ncbi:glycosyltransferase family 34 protein [Trematosphaeria pertusa]|uniref:Glycosyltransferase family 34 protein n=1 Tax=Trematosphaeria pertusa TaxID=390896 RepID=A0A6A6ISZ3_9PLEO|nr:glycosyltransferase family 34 protein [Trematosphaeria pertusa]KAF2253621.1 glycosyltransferase family 34 protein [Trematosphaeria pertusa]
MSLCSLVFFLFYSPYPTNNNPPHPPHPPLPRPIVQEHLHLRPSIPKFANHGTSRCLPFVTDDLIEEAVKRNESCRTFAPFPRSRTRISTVSVTYGERKEHIQKALQTHIIHNIIHGNDMHVMCNPIVDDLWNKPAFILSVLLEQMLLPPEERYEWLFWADRDTIILDQCRPTSSFLPPEGSDSGADTPNLVVTSDANGLNNGVFLLRVSDWAIELFEDILAFRFYNPDADLRFTEQSAMENVIRMDRFINNVAMVPQEWFNGYPNSEFGPEKFRDRNNTMGLEDFQVRRGDFIVHFAGPWDKDEPMLEWERVIRNMTNVWEMNKVQRHLDGDVQAFWREWGY